MAHHIKTLGREWRNFATLRADMQFGVSATGLIRQQCRAFTCMRASNEDTLVDRVSNSASSEWPFAAVGASQGPAGSMHGPALWPVTSAARPISPAFCSSDRRSSGFRFSSSNFSAQDQRRLGAADAALTGMCSSVAGQSHAEQRSGRHYRSFATSQTASPPAREALGPDSSPPGTEAETSPGLASPSPGSPGSAEDPDSEAAPAVPLAASGDVFVYEGPLATAVRRLKKLSLFSCTCTAAAAPIIVCLDAGSSMGAKLSIAIMLASIGAFTTGLLHWFTSPYIHRMVYHRKTGMVDLESLTLLARPRRDIFHVTSVAYPQTIRPQATFTVNGKIFYVDADNCEDKELLRLLTPADPDAVPHEPPQASPQN